MSSKSFRSALKGFLNRWHEWVLREKEGIEHIKYAYAHGINTFECVSSFSGNVAY